MEGSGGGKRGSRGANSVLCAGLCGGSRCVLRGGVGRSARRHGDGCIGGLPVERRAKVASSAEFFFLAETGFQQGLRTRSGAWAFRARIAAERAPILLSCRCEDRQARTERRSGAAGRSGGRE